ncbi:MAG: hypothetical protein K2J39_05115 [Ruminococcus sp.]|nr:hypothetical protein [Ruminococcus sp.]
MKCLIVNVKSFDYKDKKTGESVPALVLEVVKSTLSNASGKGVGDFFIGKNRQEALYNLIELGCNGDFSLYFNSLCDIEFDDQKNVIGFDLIKTEELPVIWGF